MNGGFLSEYPLVQRIPTLAPNDAGDDEPRARVGLISSTRAALFPAADTNSHPNNNNNNGAAADGASLSSSRSKSDDVTGNKMEAVGEAVVRRSFLSAAEKRQWMQAHLSQYPPAALRNPYISSDDAASDDVTPIHIAAGTGNNDMLEACLAAFWIDSTDREGRTPLIYAVIGNHPHIIQLLHKHSASLNLPDFDGRTAIHWAAYYSRHEILRLMIQIGANWRMRDNEGRTALHWATSNQSTKCLSILLERASLFEINEPDVEQMTPLHWSVYHNHPKHIRRLLRKTANFLLSDVEGKTALHWCAPHKDLACARELLSHTESRILNVADLDGRTPLHLACAENNLSLVSYLTSLEECDLDAHDILQRTALHWAAVSGHHHLVSILLEKGASDHVKDGVGATPLHYACSKNHAQCVAALLSRPNASFLMDNERRSALTWAVAKGHVQTVRILLEKGVDCNLKDNQGSTALHIAAHAGQNHCVSLLLEHGAQVDALDNQNLTPLFRAVEKGYAEVANILLLAKADVNRCDNEGRSPLHWAASFGHLPVLSLVLANGAKIDLRDLSGKTALASGAFSGHNEVVKYLLECHADIECRDKEGMTPLHWATMMGHARTVELLLVEGARPNPSNKDWTMPTPLDLAYKESPGSECANVLVQYGGKTLDEVHDRAAAVLQAAWRGRKVRRHLRESVIPELMRHRTRRDRAILVIQRAVRKFFRARGSDGMVVMLKQPPSGTAVTLNASVSTTRSGAVTDTGSVQALSSGVQYQPPPTFSTGNTPAARNMSVMALKNEAATSSNVASAMAMLGSMSSAELEYFLAAEQRRREELAHQHQNQNQGAGVGGDRRGSLQSQAQIGQQQRERKQSHQSTHSKESPQMMGHHVQARRSSPAPSAIVSSQAASTGLNASPSHPRTNSMSQKNRHPLPPSSQAQPYQTQSSLMGSFTTMPSTPAAIPGSTLMDEVGSTPPAPTSQPPYPSSTTAPHPGLSGQATSSIQQAQPVQVSMMIQEYQQQLDAIARHQQELDALRRQTEIKIQELARAMAGLQGLGANAVGSGAGVGAVRPPETIQVPMPYGISTPRVEPKVLVESTARQEEDEKTSVPPIYTEPMPLGMFMERDSKLENRDQSGSTSENEDVSVPTTHDKFGKEADDTIQLKSPSSTVGGGGAGMPSGRRNTMDWTMDSAERAYFMDQKRRRAEDQH